MVLGYSREEAGRIRTLISDALPELSCAFDPDSVFSKPVRRFEKGERLQLQARLCATRPVHVAPGQRKELDAWIADTRKRERAGEPARGREEAYADYFAEALSNGAKVIRSAVTGFVLKEFARKEFARKGAGGVPSRSTKHPVVEMDSICEVEDSEAFSLMLESGIGRSRACGCGMILVRAAA